MIDMFHPTGVPDGQSFHRLPKRPQSRSVAISGRGQVLWYALATTHCQHRPNPVGLQGPCGTGSLRLSQIRHRVNQGPCEHRGIRYIRLRCRRLALSLINGDSSRLPLARLILFVYVTTPSSVKRQPERTPHPSREEISQDA